MSNYELIKARCREEGHLWEDPEFPAAMHSIFYHQVPPFQFTWKRSKEIYQDPIFMSESDTFNIVAGSMGDKWLVSCMGILFISKRLFARVVPREQPFDDDYAGIFKFNLWHHGEWKEVLIDDRLPTINGNLVFLQTRDTQELWPALLEKAYAKILGSYEALKYGNIMDGLADMTGGVIENMVKIDADPVIIKKILLPSTMVIASSKTNAPIITPNYLGVGVYRLYDIIDVDTPNGTKYLIKLMEPIIGTSVHRKRIIIDSKDWLHIPDTLDSPDYVLILLKDFCSFFVHVDCLHLNEETSEYVTWPPRVTKWLENYYHGHWTRGISAGGCRNYLDSYFHTNPQILIKIQEPTSFLICLNQHRVMGPLTIGFTVFQVNNLTTNVATKKYLKENKNYASTKYGNFRMVTLRCITKAGSFLIIPTTHEPGEEANFTLRILSLKLVSVQLLDETLSMTRPLLKPTPIGTEFERFPFYESLFLSAANESNSVNVFELQEVLEGCLPNDYIKSCSSLETCRQIILSMNCNGTGRLTIAEFRVFIYNLKYWQTVFKNHAKERLGVLKAEGLRDTLKEIGFTFPENIMVKLILKFMRKDGMIRFGDYISIILYLYRIFGKLFNIISVKEFTSNREDAM